MEETEKPKHTLVIFLTPDGGVSHRRVADPNWEAIKALTRFLNKFELLKASDEEFEKIQEYKRLL